MKAAATLAATASGRVKSTAARRRSRTRRARDRLLERRTEQRSDLPPSPKQDTFRRRSANERGGHAYRGPERASLGPDPCSRETVERKRSPARSADPTPRPHRGARDLVKEASVSRDSDCRTVIGDRRPPPPKEDRPSGSPSRAPVPAARGRLRGRRAHGRRSRNTRPGLLARADVQPDLAVSGLRGEAVDEYAMPRFSRSWKRRDEAERRRESSSEDEKRRSSARRCRAREAKVYCSVGWRWKRNPVRARGRHCAGACASRCRGGPEELRIGVSMFPPRRRRVGAARTLVVAARESWSRPITSARPITGRPSEVDAKTASAATSCTRSCGCRHHRDSRHDLGVPRRSQRGRVIVIPPSRRGRSRRSSGTRQRGASLTRGRRVQLAPTSSKISASPAPSACPCP